MAIDTAVTVSVGIVDSLGTEASNTYYAEVDGAAVTAAGLLTMWNTLAQKVDAVVGGQIVRGHVSVVANPATVASPALKTAPTAGSRVEQTAVLNFSDVISSKKFGEAVPSLADANITGGKINLTAGQPVPLLVSFLTTASSTIAWANANQQTLVALVDAVISFRKRGRRSLRRSSFEL
jgi:hypothetical protein